MIYDWSTDDDLKLDEFELAGIARRTSPIHDALTHLDEHHERVQAEHPWLHWNDVVIYPMPPLVHQIDTYPGALREPIDPLLPRHARRHGNGDGSRTS